MLPEAELLQKVLAQSLLDDPPSPPRPKKQQHNRLMGQDLADLREAYCAEVPLKELAARFGIHRVTASAILERQGIPRRYRKLTTADLDDAAAAYAAGDSLTTIARRLGVNPTTVGRRLARRGVTLRKRNGWA